MRWEVSRGVIRCGVAASPVGYTLSTHGGCVKAPAFGGAPGKSELYRRAQAARVRGRSEMIAAVRLSNQHGSAS
jgi:hypothetical protein